MNGNLNSDNYNYRVNQTRRDDALRAAENQRLAQVATEQPVRRSLFAGLRQLFRRSTSAQPSNSAQRRSLRRVFQQIFAATLVIAVVLTSAAPSFAQAQPGAHSDPGPSEVYHPALVSYRVGYYYQFKGDQLKAIAKFSEAIDLLPNYAYAYAARGDSYALVGEYQAAIDDYTVAIGIYPDYVSALKTRGVAYAAIGEYELALADFDNAITQMPTYADAYRAAGDMYMLRGDTDKANKYYGSYAQYTVDTLELVTRGADRTVRNTEGSGYLADK